MAKVILQPIGSAVAAEQETFKNNLAQMQKLEDKLDQKRAEVKLGWGESYQQRTRDKKKMTAWERITALADNHDAIFPVNTFVNDGEKFGDGESARTSPAAGVITAFVKVHQRWVMVIANDNTVASGSWWPRTPEKIIRAQEMALKLRLPVLYLVDCSGLFLPEQGRTFPGKYGAGHIFKMNSELSHAGVPQVAGVFGDCIAGGGYMPIISDKVYMTESAYMVIAGAALIQGAKSQNLSSLDIGGASVHVHISNCADFRVPDDQTCLERIRDEVARMPSSAADYYRGGTPASRPFYAAAELSGIISTKAGVAYDIRQVIARLVDDSLFWEFWPDVGHEVIVGVAKIAGLYVGIAANVQDLLPHPEYAEKKRPGGILYREGVAKLAAFSRACDDDGLVLIWLQDIAGFDVGVEAEKQGLLGFGSSLIYSNSVREAPMITVLLRKASGAGYYAMAGMPYDPLIQLSTPISRLAVMDGRTLAIGAFNSKLDDNFAIVTKDVKEKALIEAGMKAVQDRIEADMDPYKSAAQMDTDEVVKLCELRDYLVCIVEACYQTQGYRRIKNPRIWSLHDLQILSQNNSVKNSDIAMIKNINSNLKNNLPQKEKSNQDTVLSPMEGMFYWRASAQEEPFVRAGSMLEPNCVLGLMEVMKCFYPIRYDGKESRKVTELCVSDGTSVKSGQVLLVLESKNR